MTGLVTALDFAYAARLLGKCARDMKLCVPTFRSPPRIAEVDRTLRKSKSGWVTVSVRLGDRPIGAVLADMIEGVVVANQLSGGAATRVRTTLWEAISVAQPMSNRQSAA